MAEIDWAGLMRAGIGGLGLTPTDFWGLTPAELALKLGRGEALSIRIDRQKLEQMMRRLPDRKGAENEG